MPQLEHIEAIEKRLWTAADTLRSNSNYASNEYFLPVMGLIFLRHAWSRFLMVKDQIEPTLPKRGGKTRALKKEDFSKRSAIFLRPEARFDHLVALPHGANTVKAVITAMESIEADYTSLNGSLPKAEYQELDNEVLGQLLRTLDPDELRNVSGDVFGRIYEYFLTRFAGEKAQDGGEFFTPISLVSLIAHVLDPTSGKVLDPACGSGGMFVQSARTVEEHGDNPMEKLTFYGLEKNPTTIRLARMNLAVHGLEGQIEKAITYYEAPHNLVGKADYVMANPPFNVDEIDATKIKGDPRLGFGLPGVNKADKVSNGNYVWISYFYSYLNERGRAGFVMSSQASSAGRDEAKVRRKLVETGDVDVMIAIRGNFFYTRSVPCELWFFDRAKPAEHRDKVLMIDARNVYRKVTRKIYDFTPEQEKNLLAIVALYRGQRERFLAQVAEHLERSVTAGREAFEPKADGDSGENGPVQQVLGAFKNLAKAVRPFAESLEPGSDPLARLAEFEVLESDVREKVDALDRERAEAPRRWKKVKRASLPALTTFQDKFAEPLAESGRQLGKEFDRLFKSAVFLIEACENDENAKESYLWKSRDAARARKAADQARSIAAEQLLAIRYFWKQSRWLTERFPKAELCDVEGLVKLVDKTEIEANDWSLTPGRYVGVAPEVEDEDFEFEEAIRQIRRELNDLNTESAGLALKIERNFEILAR